MVQAMRGFPATGRIFFLGIPLLPPRAGVTPRIIVSHLFYAVMDCGHNCLDLCIRHIHKDREGNCPPQQIVRLGKEVCSGLFLRTDHSAGIYDPMCLQNAS